MRYFAVACCCAALLAACQKSEPAAKSDSTAVAAAPPPAPPPPPPLSAADVAGKWNVSVKNEGGDSVVLTYVLNATNTTTGWTITFPTLPKHAPVALRVAFDADSAIIDAGPYLSALRKGQTVTTHSIARLQGGKLEGVSAAHYAVKIADSVAHRSFEGTRAP